MAEVRFFVRYLLKALLWVAFLSSIQVSIAEGVEYVFMDKVPAGFEAPEPENDFDKRLLGTVEEIGWYNLHVSEEEGAPAFAFSIGHFHKHDHPEIIVVGLEPEIAHELLDIAAVKIIGSQQRIAPYKKYADFTEGLSVAFVPVELDRYEEYLGYANWYYGSLPGPYPALQLVWPDRDGRHPWDDGYDESFSQLQPILGPMPSDE